MKIRINNLGISPLVRDCQGAILIGYPNTLAFQQKAASCCQSLKSVLGYQQGVALCLLPAGIINYEQRRQQFKQRGRTRGVALGRSSLSLYGQEGDKILVVCISYLARIYDVRVLQKVWQHFRGSIHWLSLIRLSNVYGYLCSVDGLRYADEESNQR